MMVNLFFKKSAVDILALQLESGVYPRIVFWPDEFMQK
jgi:hypothetical protein